MAEGSAVLTRGHSENRVFGTRACFEWLARVVAEVIATQPFEFDVCCAPPPGIDEQRRERLRFEVYGIDWRHTFQGKYGEFAMPRSRLDPVTLALLQTVPDLPRSREDVKATYRWERASSNAKNYTNEDKIQVMCHAGEGHGE